MGIMDCKTLPCHQNGGITHSVWVMRTGEHLKIRSVRVVLCSVPHEYQYQPVKCLVARGVLFFCSACAVLPRAEGFSVLPTGDLSPDCEDNVRETSYYDNSLVLLCILMFASF